MLEFIFLLLLDCGYICNVDHVHYVVPWPKSNYVFQNG
jgi:hypothetical protein